MDNFLVRFVSFSSLWALLTLLSCRAPEQSSHSQNEAQGIPRSVMLTAYSTTLMADGESGTDLRLALVDSVSHEVAGRTDTINLHWTGNGLITALDGTLLDITYDTAGNPCVNLVLDQGTAYARFISGTKEGKVKIEGRCRGMWPGSHEIHLIPSDFEYKTLTRFDSVNKNMNIPVMIGADVSWLPQLEDRGIVFIDNGDTIDALELIKKHGLNTIRLRLFVDPSHEKGYSPEIGYCGLSNTLEMARRIKDAGLMFLLDIHYSDYWADPQQQFKPSRWQGLSLDLLEDSVRSYTFNVLQNLNAQGTMPDVVQVGNEINHGMLWPEGHISHPDQLAELLRAGVEGVKEANPEIPVMIHLALGGQHDEAVFWLDNMLARGLEFDVLGLSYYPRWHGTLDDLNSNMRALVERYHKPVNVVEYGDFIHEVHDVVFNLPDDMGVGACIWEPLNRRSGLFNEEYTTTEKWLVYDTVTREYLHHKD